MLLPSDRAQTVLLAGAAGDSIGGPFEGQSADSSAAHFRGAQGNRLRLLEAISDALH